MDLINGSLGWHEELAEPFTNFGIKRPILKRPHTLSTRPKGPRWVREMIWAVGVKGWTYSDSRGQGG